MFEKLRRKFIFINMGLLTIVFLCIFGVIFTVTAVNLERDMLRSLGEIIGFEDHYNGGPAPKRKPNDNSIIVELDTTENIAKVFKSTYLDVDEEILQSSIDKIIDSNEENSKINIDGTSYSYLMKTTSYGIKIALIDRTYQQSLLSGLLRSFVAVGALSLIALLFISIYLTNKSIKPIKDTFEKQKQFIADASHELKTPLTIIKTNTSLILSEPKETIEKQRKWIDYISSQADRMSELVNEMLYLAKLDVEENRIKLLPMSISKTIESTLLGFDAVIYENNIALETNISENIEINGDKESIKKLFSILIDNAIKHSNKTGKLTIDLYSEKNKVKLKVKNTGEGIEKEYLDKIFERFYRIDNSRVRETGGYGLGLSIAKSIVEQHKGKIYAQSNVGSDTTFIVELPK